MVKRNFHKDWPTKIVNLPKLDTQTASFSDYKNRYKVAVESLIWRLNFPLGQ